MVYVPQAKPILDSLVDVDGPVTDISPKRIIASDEKSRFSEIMALMLSKKLRKIPLVDKNNHLKGIITSVDMLNFLGGGDKHEIFKKNRKGTDIGIERIMTKHIISMHFKTSIKKASEIFRRDVTGLYPLVDSKKLISLVSEWDFVKLVKKPLGIRVYEAMVEKPIFAKKDHSAYDVAKMMVRGGFRRLPIVQEGIVVGIVTPADVLLHIDKNNLEDRFVFDKTEVAEMMNKKPVAIGDEADIFSAVRVMKENKVGGLPVIQDDEIVGMITKRDVLDVLI